ncbi:MAG: UDP-N-acetylmuramoyl-L-alanyl-D-glutamate--2,6-diaminopimelate ligase [Patescibacteria group bacterium]
MLNKTLIRRFIPRWLLSCYHLVWAILGNLVYNFPTGKLIVAGVTGTKGKSTVAAMICHSLNKLGLSCGLISTAMIKIGKQEWLNDLKMTMPGRLTLQKYLRQMVQAGHKYAVVETSSEGIAQWRHWGIRYDAAVFTNLTPEHIETHGSFTKYQQSKEKLWQVLNQHVKIIAGHKIIKVSVVNGDDSAAQIFLNYPADEKYIYGLQSNQFSGASQIIAEQVKVEERKISFTVDSILFTLPVGGKFNVYNALASIAYLLSQDFSLKQISESMKDFAGAPGRMEFINAGQSFQVVVDYAHTPESLEEVYKTLTQKKIGKLIAVLGSCGGGRDKAKRPVLGKLAGQFADQVIVTNEDPYDEDPQVIIEAVVLGAKNIGKQLGKNLWQVMDRRQAIAKALKLAVAGDTVIITGKGSEQWLVTKQGKIPWDDRQIVKQELKKITNNL